MKAHTVACLRDIAQAFEAQSSAKGFDIVHPFNSQWYNNHIATLSLSTPLAPLPTLSHPQSCGALLIGNSKAVWPHFVDWLKQAPGHRCLTNPFDTFCEESLLGIAQDVIPTRGVRYAMGCQDLSLQH